MSKSVAVTGGTGMVGSQVLNQLLELGYSVHALHRSQSSFNLVKVNKAKVKWVEGDLSQLASLEELIRGRDYVIHVAGLIASESHAKRMMDVNVRGTANVVNVCLESNVERLVHVSSVAALGRPSGDAITNRIQSMDVSFTYRILCF